MPREEKQLDIEELIIKQRNRKLAGAFIAFSSFVCGVCAMNYIVYPELQSWVLSLVIIGTSLGLYFSSQK